MTDVEDKKPRKGSATQLKQELAAVREVVQRKAEQNGEYVAGLLECLGTPLTEDVADFIHYITEGEFFDPNAKAPILPPFYRSASEPNTSDGFLSSEKAVASSPEPVMPSDTHLAFIREKLARNISPERLKELTQLDVALSLVTQNPGWSLPFAQLVVQRAAG